VGITTAIHGAGGFGKTALAIEFCYDGQVRERYPDGVLWTTMGEEIDAAGRLARVRDLIRWWTEKDPPAFETVSAACAHLRQELAGKRVFLVVDDVWRPEDVTPFQGLAALLVTTRDSRTLPSSAVPVHVDAMEVPEAVQLLGAGLSGGAEVELKTLAARLGEWPLLLKIVNRQVAGWIGKGLDLQEAVRRAESALKAKGLTFFDAKDAKDRSQAVALTLEVSLERLRKQDQERFGELAIFPEDAEVPLVVLEKLWQLDSFEVEEIVSRFFDISLLRNFDFRSGTIRLHDVIPRLSPEKGREPSARVAPATPRRLPPRQRPLAGSATSRDLSLESSDPPPARGGAE
jgi:NB-ARC domain-containing protein